MTLFKIIDRKTGKEPTDRVIAAQARLGQLITCDIDGFYVNEDGQIILVDDCGNCTWLDMNRFKVCEHDKSDVLNKIKAEIEEQKKERCFDDDDMFVYRAGLNDAIYIIDKYKAESEEGNDC